MTRDRSRQDEPREIRHEAQDATHQALGDDGQRRGARGPADVRERNGDASRHAHEARHEPPSRRSLDETPLTPPARTAVSRRRTVEAVSAQEPAARKTPIAAATAAEAWSDEAIDERLGRLLQFGVLLAGSVVCAGALLYLWRHGHELVDYSTFRGQPDELRTISGILHGTRTGRARGLIQLGLLLLVATPIARVAFAGYAFVRQRDWLYAGIALFVLAFLFVSLRGGFS